VATLAFALPWAFRTQGCSPNLRGSLARVMVSLFAIILTNTSLAGVRKTSRRWRLSHVDFLSTIRVTSAGTVR